MIWLTITGMLYQSSTCNFYNLTSFDQFMETERESVCCLMPISAVSWLEQIHFNEVMMMMSTLHKTNTVSYFSILTYWNNSARVDMSVSSDTLSWFRASQSVLSNNNNIILPLTCYCFLLILTFSSLCCKILMVQNCKTLYGLCHEKQLKTPNICLKI
jgi:hypothetical protein